jgi:hypothetical protein
MTKIKAKTRNRPSIHPVPSQELSGYALDRYSWKNWYLLMGIASMIMLAFILVVPHGPVEQLGVGRHLHNMWPWINTEMILLIGFCLLSVLSFTYLTLQQRKVIAMQRHLHTLEAEKIISSEKYNSRLYALLSVSRMVSSETNLKGVFDYITEKCADVFGAERTSLMLVDEKTRELVVRSTSASVDSDKILDKRKKIGEGIAGWVAKNREPLILTGPEDEKKYPSLEFNNPDLSAAMVVPIIVRDELVGILNVSTRKRNAPFSEEDLQALLVFAENAGACIRHTEQAIWMRKTIENLRETVASKN